MATALLLAFALLLSFPELPPFKAARLALFDQYQSLLPRQSRPDQVVIVEIDEASLAALGQWPWPRNFFAALIDAIGALKPAAIGLDIIWPEPDHASPRAVAESRPDLPEGVRNALLGVTSNDQVLAESFAGAPVVLGAAGMPGPTSSTQSGLHTQTVELHGRDDPLQWLKHYPCVLASLPEFQAAARGQALLSSDPENGIVRRATLVSDLNRSATPGLALEMLRVAHGAKTIEVSAGRHGIEGAAIGSMRIPLQGNGEAWVHFDRSDHRRYLSATQLLQNQVPPERIAGKLVLVGLTGLGLQDMITTPLGDRRAGVEVHAQLLESFEDGHFLMRPWWMQWVELGVLVCGGLLLIWAIPNTKNSVAQRRWIAQRRSNAQAGVSQRAANPQAMPERRKRNRAVGIKPSLVALLAFLLFGLLFGAGIALFAWGGVLFDAANLSIALGCVFGSLVTSIFVESDHQRTNAERALQEQRVKAAQLAGELDAARRIQLGTLPSAAAQFPGETRFEIDAMLEPARQVGGDLYDFFMIDPRRLFFIIGDVSGKGLPASLFMVVTKALAKSSALRESLDVGQIISKANAEMARENPEMLFVTAVAGILDVESGALELVNAGHDAPWRIGADARIESLSGDGGPPLCVLDDFDYPVERRQLSPGDTVFLLTDGITEAMNGNKDLYSMARVSAVLERAALAHPHPDQLVTALREDVRAFVGDAEASDDLTLLVLRWAGKAQPEPS